MYQLISTAAAAAAATTTTNNNLIHMNTKAHNNDNNNTRRTNIMTNSGGTERATSANMPLLLLQSSEGRFTRSCETEPVRRSFCRHGSCTFTGVACLVPYNYTCI